MANIPEISVSPQVVFHIGDYAVTNALFSSVIVTLIFFLLVYVVKSKLAIIPGRLQIVAESIIEFFYTRLIDAYGDSKRARKHTALVVSLFVFILISNYFTLIPLVQSVVVEGTPLFKAPTAHFALTLAMAIIVSVVAHVIAFSTHPIRHIGNFIKVREFAKVRSFKDLPNAFLEFFLGLMDMLGEVGKVLSLSARLFGNVFAGEVVVGVIAGLSFYTQFFIPVPFFILSILSGLIQAMVFAILAMAFISMMAKSVEESAD